LNQADTANHAAGAKAPVSAFIEEHEMGTSLTAILLAAAIGAPPANDEPAVLMPSARAGASDLFLLDAAKGDAKNITKSEAAEEIHPAYSPDGKRIAFCCKTKEHELEVYVCDADGSNRKRLTEAETPSGCFTPSWSADGKSIVYQRLLTGGKTEVRIVNADGTKDRLLVADGHGPAWSPDGSCIVFSLKKAGKSSLCTLNADGGDLKTLVEDLGPDAPYFPAWSPDGKLIAISIATEYGLQVALVPAAGGSPRQITHVPGININPVWIAADRILFGHTPQPGVPGGAFVVVKPDGTRLTIHPLSKLEPPHPISRPAVFLPRPEKPVESAVKPASHVEPAASKPSPMKIAPVAVLPPAAPGAVVAASWASDGKRIALAFEAGLVVTLEHENNTMKPVDVFRGHEGGVSGVVMSADGKLLFSSAADKSVRTWDFATKGSKTIATDSESPLESLAASADGKFLATGDRDGKLHIRNAATNKIERSVPVCDPNRGAVHAVALGKGDTVLFASCAKWSMPVLGGCVAAFDPATGKELWRTKGTMGGVFSLAVSPDGTRLAGACLDTFIRIWDAKTGKELACWKGHGERASGVAWVLGGSALVSCGFDHTVRLWDAATGANTAVLAAHASPVVRVSASPDGQRVISLGQSGSLCMWKLSEK
jgi:WD40 repeat protein